MTNRVRTLLILIVSAVWALNFTAPIFIKDFQPAPELNVAFMAILGVLTSTYKRDDDNDEDDKDNKGTRQKRKETDR